MTQIAPRRCARGLRLAGVLAAALLALPAVPPAAAASPPTELIRSFQDTLLSVMKRADTLGLQGRFEALAPEIEETFNFPFMIRLAVGNRWAAASEPEKEALIEAFSRFSVGAYAARFDGFSGEAFEVVEERDGPGGSRLVVTRIVRPNKAPVPITYVTREFEEGWRIYDVLLEGGISELAVKRSEYNRILKRSGPNGLVDALNRKADQILEK